MKILLVLYDGGKSAEEEPRLLGTTENKLGIASWLEEQGHTLITTSSKEGADSEFRKEIVDSDILITTPFHPGYLTREVMDSAKQLKLCITAGVGSDHIVSRRSLEVANKPLV
jgi:formate dehydrogenase